VHYFSEKNRQKNILRLEYKPVTLIIKFNIMEYPIYTVLGVLFVIYLFITIYNRNKSKRRRSKKFMDGYHREEKKKTKN